MNSIKDIAQRFVILFKIIQLFKNWEVILAHRFLKKELDDLLKLRNGLQFYTNKTLLDVVVILENFSGVNKHDYFKTAKLSKKPKIIDIGAHIGTFSIHAATKYPNTLIFSYEPDEKNYQNLIKNIEINNIRNVVAFNKAVGKTNGVIPLYSDDEGNFGTAGSSLVHVGPKSVNVSCITLESIFKENQIDQCDLLKMDCEGGEYDIILNSDTQIFNKIKSIALEYHTVDKHQVSELEHSLENLGYRVTRIPNYNNEKFGFIYAAK